MAELIQLRRSLREESKSLNYSDEETNKFITEQLALHAANEETRRLEEEKIPYRNIVVSELYRSIKYCCHHNKRARRNWPIIKLLDFYKLVVYIIDSILLILL